MRRPLSRLVVSLWILWFALITVGPGGFGACPEHGPGGHDHPAVRPSVAQTGALPVVTPEAAPPADRHAGHHGHHPMAAQEPPASSGTPAPAPHHCTCLGACCMMAPSALPAPTEWLAATFAAPRVPPTPAYRSVIAARRVFTQPYAIGPPAAPIA